MIKSLTRSLLVGLAIVSVAIPGALQANASTGPWNWTDLSAKVAERANRPIWAVARGESYWYFTDGQDLYTGGHVWRTDGGILADITKEVRMAGLSRVDDIVSDGQTVLFLKNVTLKNNSIEVVSYNGNYTNITWQIRPYLDYATGVTSITGKSGMWAIVTTKGQVIFWNSAQNQINTFLSANSNFQSDIYYSMRHVAPSDSYFYMPVSAAPISTGWLVSSRDTNGVTRFWNYTSYGVSTEITNQFSRITNVQLMASSGNTAIFGGVDTQNNTKRMYTYDGVNVKDVTSAIPSNMNTWNSLIAGWNGTSWMFVGNGSDSMSKHLYRFDGSTFQDLGTTQDFFLTIAGNLNGTFLMGGAVSDVYHSASPTSPLTAKLVKITEDGYGTSNSNTGATITNGISAWAWTDSYQTAIRHDQTINFNVGAWSQDGIKRIEIYANGSLRRTCDYGVTWGNQTCTATIYGSDYGYNANIALTARVTNGNNQITWTSTQQVKTYIDAIFYYKDTVPATGDISVWNSVDPSGSTLLRGNSATLRVQANASQGLRQIDVYANGSLRRTCTLNNAYGTQGCDATIYGTDFAVGTIVSLNARATDVYGKTAWSDVRTLTIADNGTYYQGTNTNYSGTGSSWIWSTPETTQVTQSQPVTFNVGAWDPNGIKRIEIFVNNAIVNTCNFGLAYGNQNCTYQVNTSYAGITYANVSALITNGQNQTFWSQTKNYVITNDSTTTVISPSFPTDLPGNIRVTSDADNGYSKSKKITFTATANDQDGIDRIDILVNATLVKTCTNTNTCSYTGGPYTNRNTVSYGAKIIDKKGYALWTGYKTINKK